MALGCLDRRGSLVKSGEAYAPSASYSPRSAELKGRKYRIFADEKPLLAI